MSSTRIVNSLLDWFSLAARPLPWRKSSVIPYEIWISEIMSQQSTLKMMLPYFEKWMKRFPDLSSLARAEEEVVLKHWEGLGYYSRARNVHRAAKLLEKNFPQTPQELLEFPGIGPYTSAAVASIAFDYPAVPVDGNVIRVLSRYFGIKDPFAQKKDMTRILEEAQKLALLSPPGSRGALAQSLMELGALVCRPQESAKCFECPLRTTCYAAQKKIVGQVPAPKSRPEMHKIARLLLVYRNQRGEPLLRKRPESWVLGGQWELPYLDLELGAEDLKKLLARHFELKKPFKHTIMHRVYTVWPLELGLWAKAPRGHLYHGARFKGVLSTMTRKFLDRVS